MLKILADAITNQKYKNILEIKDILRVNASKISTRDDEDLERKSLVTILPH